MTDDTTKAPERIWVAQEGQPGAGLWGDKEVDEAVEYVRADLSRRAPVTVKPTREQIEDAICDQVDEGTFEYGTNAAGVISEMTDAVMSLINAEQQPTTAQAARVLLEAINGGLSLQVASRNAKIMDDGETGPIEAFLTALAEQEQG